MEDPHKSLLGLVKGSLEGVTFELRAEDEDDPEAKEGWTFQARERASTLREREPLPHLPSGDCPPPPPRVSGRADSPRG